MLEFYEARGAFPEEQPNQIPGDKDTPYHYSQPTSERPRPFRDRDMIGILKLRGRVQDARHSHRGPYADDLTPAHPLLTIGAISDWISQPLS